MTENWAWKIAWKRKSKPSRVSGLMSVCAQSEWTVRQREKSIHTATATATAHSQIKLNVNSFDNSARQPYYTATEPDSMETESMEWTRACVSFCIDNVRTSGRLRCCRHCCYCVIALITFTSSFFLRPVICPHSGECTKWIFFRLPYEWVLCLFVIRWYDGSCRSNIYRWIVTPTSYDRARV